MEGVQIASGNAVAASLMRWWREAGVDTFVEDTPRDWLAPPRPVSAPAQAAPETAAPPSPAPASTPLPDTLDALLTWMRESGDVPEARWGRKRLLPAGNPQADIAIMIDAPDSADMAADTLLSGEIGALFDKMLAAIGLDRAAIWLTPFATIRPLGRVPQDALRRHERTGRPLGGSQFIAELEHGLGRRLRPGKPGRRGKEQAEGLNA